MQSVITKGHGTIGCRAPCRLQRQQKQHAQAGKRATRVSVAASAHNNWGSSSTQQQQQGSATADMAAFKRLMVLPGGAWWMSADAAAEAPVYGDSFIMQSRRHQQAAAVAAGSRSSGAAGLVRLRPQRAVAAVQPRQSREIIPLSMEDVEVSIVVLSPDGASSSTTTLALSTSSRSSSSIVPFRRLLADPDVSDEQLQLSVTDGSNNVTSSSSSTSLAIVPRDNTMLGVVMSSAVRRRGDDVPLPSDDETVYETPFNDKNPRRTMKIKFKCKRCGATTIKPINPHAWATGTVFAKCGCCQVTHKLIDNLKLFHELAGPVFGPGTQAPPAPKRERLGLRLESDSMTLPQLPDRFRLRFPADGFPDDIAGLN